VEQRAGRKIHGWKSEKLEPTNHDLPMMYGVSGAVDRFKSERDFYISTFLIKNKKNIAYFSHVNVGNTRIQSWFEVGKRV
jgi:hypothetical protein